MSNHLSRRGLLAGLLAALAGLLSDKQQARTEPTPAAPAPPAPPAPPEQGKILWTSVSVYDCDGNFLHGSASPPKPGAMSSFTYPGGSPSTKKRPPKQDPPDHPGSEKPA